MVGRDVPVSPAPGVHGGEVLSGDPIGGEWTIAVVGPHLRGRAGRARAPRAGGADGEPEYDYVLTYDRERATAVAAALTARVGT